MIREEKLYTIIQVENMGFVILPSDGYRHGIIDTCDCKPFMLTTPYLIENYETYIPNPYSEDTDPKLVAKIENGNEDEISWTNVLVHNPKLGE